MPKPLLYALGAVFIAAAAWFIYADRTVATAKAPAPASALKK